MENEITKKWEEYGLLDNYKGDKDVLAIKYEEMAKYLMNSEHSDSVNTCAFPCLRRACANGLVDYYTAESMCNDLEYVLTQRMPKDAIEFNIDWESKVCEIVSEKYSKDNNRPKFN